MCSLGGPPWPGEEDIAGLPANPGDFDYSIFERIDGIRPAADFIYAMYARWAGDVPMNPPNARMYHIDLGVGAEEADDKYTDGMNGSNGGEEEGIAAHYDARP